MKDLLRLEKRILPYVSNVHQSIGKLMDVAISQAIDITENYAHNKPSLNNGRALRLFFYDHLSYDQIRKELSCSKENVRRYLIGKFIFGEEYVEGISLSTDFKNKVKNLTSSMLY